MASSHLFIITGASRGLGLALARELLLPGHTLILMARHANTSLHAPPGAWLEQWQHDLGDGAPAAQRLGKWLATQTAQQYASATLINNAGQLAHIAPLAQCADGERQASVAAALRVGLEAPMLLTAQFLAATERWPARRKVLNISSGLGRRPMAAQAAYCAAKAGLDHFTRCVALEEAAKPHGARICALAPGVIDTDMQLQLRSADATAFPDRERFLRLDLEQQLSSAQAAAAHVLAWLQRPDFGVEPVADIRVPASGPGPAGMHREKILAR